MHKERHEPHLRKKPEWVFSKNRGTPLFIPKNRTESRYKGPQKGYPYGTFGTPPNLTYTSWVTGLSLALKMPVEGFGFTVGLRGCDLRSLVHQMAAKLRTGGRGSRSED